LLAICLVCLMKSKEIWIQFVNHEHVKKKKGALECEIEFIVA